jgi:hypothetical protein
MNKTAMKRYVPCSVLCLTLLFLTGCFDTKEEFTLNPDGSGRVVIETICAPLQLQMNGQQTPEQKLQGAIRSILDNVKGITAWKDVTYERQDDGRIKFKGTAYFADINKVEFQNLALMNFTLKKGADGNLVLGARTDQKQNTSPTVPTQLTDAEMTAKIKDAKGGYQSSRPMLAGFLTTMRQEAVFHLPGAVSDITNFKSTPAGDLQIIFAGTNLLAAMDSLATNNEWWRLQLAEGRDVSPSGLSLNNDLNEKLFGQRAPVRAVITGGTPKFDYAAEAAAAKTEYTAILRKLGPINGGEDVVAETTDLAPPAQGGEFKSLKVGGVRWVFTSDDKNNVRPFNYPPGYTLSFIGELPGSVMAVSGGEVDTAIALDGSDLLPDTDWDRKINFPNLSTDRATVVFEVNLKAPGPEARGFKEISGSLRYSVGLSITNIDLGITEIKAGAKGNEFGASIQSIKPGFGEKGGENIILKLLVGPTEIISLKAIGTDGQEINLRQTSYGGYNRTYTFTYHANVLLPSNARLIIQKYGEIKKYVIPFKLSNLTFLGQPLP